MFYPVSEPELGSFPGSGVGTGAVETLPGGKDLVLEPEPEPSQPVEFRGAGSGANSAMTFYSEPHRDRSRLGSWEPEFGLDPSKIFPPPHFLVTTMSCKISAKWSTGHE